MLLRSVVSAAAAAFLASTLLLPVPTAALSASDSAVTKANRRCMGERATIVRNNRDNIIFGTNRRDVIVAGGGLDVVYGRGGRDLICGGRGADLLDGNQRIDKINGGNQRDHCFGQRREHRNHRSCEVHRIPQPNGGEPQGRVADSRDLLAALVEPQRDNHTFGADRVVCDEGTIPAHFNLGNIYYTGLYANGQIAVRIHIVPWTGAGWDANSARSGPWLYGPADANAGQYSTHMGTPNMPDFSFAVVYEAWWSDANGQDWVGQTYRAAPGYVLRGYGVDLPSNFCA